MSVVPPAAAACAALAGALVLARRLLVVVTIRGPSMLPTYQTGDRVLVRRCLPSTLRRRQVVLVAEAGGPHWLIKRVAALPGDPVPEAVRPVVAGTYRVPEGQLVILGDGTNSHDSRQFGFVDAERVLGVVLARLPAHREVLAQPRFSPTTPSAAKDTRATPRPEGRRP